MLPKSFLILFSVLALGLTACDSQLSSQSVDSINGGQSTPGGGDSGVIEIPEELDLVGKIGEGAYAGLEVVSIDPVNKEFIMKIPMPIPFGKEVKKAFNDNDLSGGYYMLTQYEINKWAVEIHLPLEKFVNGKLNEVPAAKLPNGQDLPGIVSGELPGFAIQWEDDSGDKEFYLYLGGGNAAIFVPTYNFDPFFAINIPIKDENKNRVGWFSTVPEMNDSDGNLIAYGGIYMAILLPSDLAKWIDNNLQ
ncbi:MAG: hypothetical protein VX642_16280 [Bdellovibrionota bacterium]|nr:hypothetical protein [Bdellovibrionota bacterium]